MKDWFDNPGDDFDSPEARDAETSQFMEGMQAQLAAAGYDLSKDKDLEFGMLAYNAAFMMMDRAGVRSRKASKKKVGRNAPCPCGSGKKYKKCCLGGTHAADKLRRQMDSSLHPPAEMIPCITDVKKFSTDMGELEDLLVDDPALREVRFNQERVTRHYIENRPENPPEDPDDALEVLDRLSFDYVAKHEEKEVFERCREALLKAGKRAQLMRVLRALCLGEVLLTLGDETNLVAACLYRIALGDRLERENTESTLMNKVKGVLSRGGIEPTLDAVKKAVFDERAAEQLLAEDDGSLTALVKDTESKLEELRDNICDGHFPVLAPTSTVLPLYVAATVAARRGETVGQKQTEELVKRILADWGDDDTRLYASLLSEWLEVDDGSHPDVTAKVRLLHSMAQLGGLSPITADLVYGSVTTGRLAMTDWEDKMEPDAGPGAEDGIPVLSAEFLEAYGDAMLEHGYKQIALRVWELCEMLGPVPDSVARKMSNARKSAA